MLNKDKLKILKQIIKTTKKNFESAERLISELAGDESNKKSQTKIVDTNNSLSPSTQEQEIVEGVFDGQSMIGADGKKYPVPENYASKSKLIQGDILKLTITSLGQYVYKQISPQARVNLRGELDQDSESSQFFVKVNDKKYKVLTASVTYYDGKVGDEAIIIVPKDQETDWAAVEDIKPKDNFLASAQAQDEEKLLVKKTDKPVQNVDDLLGEIEEI